MSDDTTEKPAEAASEAEAAPAEAAEPAKQDPEAEAAPSKPSADKPADKPADKDEDIAEAAPPDPEEALAIAAEMRKRWRVFAVLSIVSFAADQVTKIWARASLPTIPIGHPTGDNGACAIPDDIAAGICHGKPVSVIDGFWHWRLSMNPGSAFGLFASGGLASRVLLSAIGIGAVILMFQMLRKARPDQKILHWALALIASGAVGNLVDRIHYGVVTDFILWHVGEPRGDNLTWKLEWPVFNVADIALVIGVGLMVIDMLRDWKRDREKKARALAKAKATGLIRDL
jgi:signal peptidase II